MPDTCEHHYVLDEIDPNQTATGRVVHFHCQKCDKPGQIITLKTDAEINDVFAEAAPSA
jgi:hypothetical protein